MDILEKLDAIQVQPDSRISDKDRRYCETHQKAYQEAKNMLGELECVWKDMTERQKTILMEVESDSYQMNPYTSIEGLSAEKIHERADALHGIFIRKLVGYFERTYRVTLQTDDIIRALLPDQPESSSYHPNVVAWREYHRQLDALLLDYRNVLDRIFVQLGSRTFLERALDELKENCHRAAWNIYRGKADFERKNDTIRFFSYACTCDDRWGRSERWSLNDGMKNILRGMAHYETGTFDAYPPAIAGLLGWGDQDCPLMEFTGCQKLKSLRMYKNGRVDVKFQSRKDAQQFVSEYLGDIC